MARVTTVASPTGPDAGTMAAAYSGCIERTREALYARLLDAPAAGVLREYFERAKMLRAFLVFAASASVGGDPEDVLMAAVAIELLHGASLFHDDIIDQARTRRGIVSLHERLGVGPRSSSATACSCRPSPRWPRRGPAIPPPGCSKRPRR